MYDYEEGMTKCQNEIRRLRNVVRADEEKIERLKVLLLNAIGLAEEGIVDTQAEPFEYESKAEWLEEKIGITREELEEIGFGFPEDEED